MTAYDDAVLADAPLCFYKCDETSGTALADTSGNAYAAGIVGTPTFHASSPLGNTIGWADSSGATKNYAVSGAKLPSVKDHTYEALVYIPSAPTNDTPIAGLADAFGANGQLSNMYVGSGMRLQAMIYRSGANATLYTSATALVLATWYHLAVSIGPLGVMMHVNGAQTDLWSSDTSTTSSSSFLLVHGGGSSGAQRIFTLGSAIQAGRVALYASQLSVSQIASHAACLPLSGVWSMI